MAELGFEFRSVCLWSPHEGTSGILCYHNVPQRNLPSFWIKTMFPSLMSTQLPCEIQACPELTVPERSSSGSPWTIREHWAVLPLTCLPSSCHTCCLRPAADWGKRSKLFPRNQPFLLLSSLIQGSVTWLHCLLGCHLPIHSLLIGKNFFWLAAIRSFFLSVYSLPNLKFASIILSKTSIAIQYRS